MPFLVCKSCGTVGIKKGYEGYTKANKLGFSHAQRWHVSHRADRQCDRNRVKIERKYVPNNGNESVESMEDREKEKGIEMGEVVEKTRTKGGGIKASKMEVDDDDEPPLDPMEGTGMDEPMGGPKGKRKFVAPKTISLFSHIPKNSNVKYKPFYSFKDALMALRYNQFMESIHVGNKSKEEIYGTL